MPPPPEPTESAAHRPERGDVTIGIVTALWNESAAVRKFVDHAERLHFDEDPNEYWVGFLGSSDNARPHRVAVVQLPEDNTRNAAATCIELLRTFQGIRCVLMVGIAGGIPAVEQPERHVRLGDVVVAVEGIVDYGHIRQADGVDVLRRPVEGMSLDLKRAVDELRQRELEDRSRSWAQPTSGPGRPLAAFSRPPARTDQLTVGGRRIEHPDPALTGHRPGRPKAHYGMIGSGDVLVRDAQRRDELAARYGILAVEMEGAGIAAAARQRGVPWFVVRGISDYCDGEKSDHWQRYAALMAASYTRTLLSVFRPYPSWSAAPGSGVLALVPDPERDDIIRALSQVPDLDPRAMWHSAAGSLARMPDQPLHTIGEVFDHLATLNADDGLPPAVALLEEAAALAGESQARTLAWWSNMLADRLHAGEPLRRRRRQRSATADRHQDTDPAVAPPARAAPDDGAPQEEGAPNPGDRPCLVVQIVPDGIEPGRYLAGCWIQKRTGPWRPEPGGDDVEARWGSLQAELDRFVRSAEEEWRADIGPITIEFLLPTDLLNQPVEWWLRDLDSPAPTPLCADYDVVLRSADRMHDGRSYRYWLSRWQTLWQPPGRLRHRVVRRDEAESDFSRWATRLHIERDVGVVVLSTSPDHDDGRAELDIALRAGIAVIIWDRRGPIRAADEPTVSRLAEDHPAHLLRRLDQLRKEAAMAAPESVPAHLGRHLAVLWDDATRPIDLRGAGR
jgi:nucleoside phosphorylase